MALVATYDDLGLGEKTRGLVDVVGRFQPPAVDLREHTRQYLVDVGHHLEANHLAGIVDEPALSHLPDEFTERVPEPVRVEEDDRLLMPAELPPRHDLDGLFERPNAARKDEEGIRLLVHPALPLVHVIDEDLLPVMREALTLNEESRHDAENLPSVLVGAQAGSTHQADLATAVDEAALRQGDDAPDLLGVPFERGIVPERGSTEDADGFNEGAYNPTGL